MVIPPVVEYVRELSKSGGIKDIDKTAHSAPDAHAFSDAEFVCDEKKWTFHLMQVGNVIL